MSEICLKLKVFAQIDFNVFLLPYGSNKPKILGFNFSRPSTTFYDTFKMAAIEITYLAITWALVAKVTIFMYIPMFLGMSNPMVPIKNVYASYVF